MRRVADLTWPVGRTGDHVHKAPWEMEGFQGAPEGPISQDQSHGFRIRPHPKATQHSTLLSCGSSSWASSHSAGSQDLCREAVLTVSRSQLSLLPGTAGIFSGLLRAQQNTRGISHPEINPMAPVIPKQSPRRC